MDYGRKYALFSIAFVILLITLFSVYGMATSDVDSKLGPTLSLLVARNERSIENTGKPLNLAPYGTMIGVYSDHNPVVNRITIHKDHKTSYKYKVPEGAQAYRLGMLVKTTSPSLLEAKGVYVGTVAGNIVTARATLNQLREFIRLPSVNYAVASKRVNLNLNVSVPAVGGDQLHQSNPTLTGKGVLVGDVDTGIDYNHKDFRVEKNPGDGVKEETSRILYIWDQTGTEPPSPASYSYKSAPPLFGYGEEYTNQQIEQDIRNGNGPFSGAVTESDVEGHGTHVAGIMAGDGSSNPDPSQYPTYKGMAADSRIVMVKTTLSTSDIIDGVNYIFQKAANRGEPAVVNLSLGSHYGPHDGTSLFCRALSELSKEGHIIVVSAGNEGNSFIHANDTLAPGEDATVKFNIQSSSSRLSGAATINTWYPRDCQFKVTVTSPDGEVSKSVPSGEKLNVDTNEGTIYIDNASGGVNPQNGDKQLEVELLGPGYGSSHDITPGTWEMTFSAPEGTPGGRFDSWFYHHADGESFLPPLANNRMTVGVPGVAQEVITVGAYITKTSWTTITGNEVGYVGMSPATKGNIAPFSSRGPTRDGRPKPDLSAPGMGIGSTLAGANAQDLQYNDPSYYTSIVLEDGKHRIMQGTSMSAPHVAGMVALLLQEDPSLTPAEAKQQLKQTAVADQYTDVGYDPRTGTFTRSTGPVLNYTWGAGKLNADQAARSLALGIPGAGNKPRVVIGPNPAGVGNNQAYVHYTLPPDTDKVHLRVYNVADRLVFDTDLDPADNTYTWNLTNNRGEPLANGYYIYVITADGVRSDLGHLMIERK